MYEAAFKYIDDQLWKDAGCGNELDYVEQTSWILFLKYLDDFEMDREAAAKLKGEPYIRIIDGDYRWESWAAPKNADGTLDYNAVMTGDDLCEFVNESLFPHLSMLQDSAESPHSIDYKIGEIFGVLRNKIQSGYTLRNVIDKIDELKFLSDDHKHELSNLYEDKIRNMGNAGRNGGEYYTPRPLIKSIVKIIDPKIGETVYDGAVGSAGFLCEAYKWIYKNTDMNATTYKRLQKNTFYGKEKKILAYIIGIMNMILHGIETPNITHTNTLTENIAEIQQSEKVDVILANPPFGGNERTEIQQNFPIKSSETAYLFLQHFIKMLKSSSSNVGGGGGGRCGVVIKSTFLSNTDNASVKLREHLLKECNLFTILDIPAGAFIGTGVKTVVLFFEKGKSTEKIWYYQLNVGRNMGKTNPLSDQDLEDFISIFHSQKTGINSWLVDISDVDPTTWDLTPKNPNVVEKIDVRSPTEIIAEIESLDAQATQALQKIREIL